MNSEYIAGLTDGEGHFGFGMMRNKSQKYNWQIQPRYQLIMRDNKGMLENMKQYLIENGLRNPIIKYNIRSHKGQNHNLKGIFVGNFEDCKKIYELLKNTSLTIKREEMEVWNKALDILLSKRNKTKDEQIAILNCIKQIREIRRKKGISSRRRRINIDEVIDEIKKCE